MRKKVGIVIRTKDRPLLLKRALESVLAQTFPDWALVVVNDGGDPAPIDALVEPFLQQAQGRLLLRHNVHCTGMECASNRGIAELDCEYLAIHDDDDTWSPEFLAVAVAEMERVRADLPSVAAVVTMASAVFEHIDSEANAVHVDRIEPYRPWMRSGLIGLDAMLVENQFAPIQMLFRSDVAHEIGLFREDLPVLGDWDFNVRLMLRYDIYLIPSVLAYYHHRLNDNGIYGNSIFASRSRHQLYLTLIRNDWLRRDIGNHGDLTPAGGAGRLGGVQTLQFRLQETLTRLDAVRDEVAALRAEFAEAAPTHRCVAQPCLLRSIGAYLLRLRPWGRSRGCS